jgi:hypothetical protein
MRERADRLRAECEEAEAVLAEIEAKADEEARANAARQFRARFLDPPTAAHRSRKQLWFGITVKKASSPAEELQQAETALAEFNEALRAGPAAANRTDAAKSKAVATVLAKRVSLAKGGVTKHANAARREQGLPPLVKEESPALSAEAIQARKAESAAKCRATKAAKALTVAEAAAIAEARKPRLTEEEVLAKKVAAQAKAKASRAATFLRMMQEGSGAPLGLRSDVRERRYAGFSGMPFNVFSLILSSLAPSAFLRLICTNKVMFNLEEEWWRVAAQCLLNPLPRFDLNAFMQRMAAIQTTNVFDRRPRLHLQEMPLYGLRDPSNLDRLSAVALFCRQYFGNGLTRAGGTRVSIVNPHDLFPAGLVCDSTLNRYFLRCWQGMAMAGHPIRCVTTLRRAGFFSTAESRLRLENFAEMAFRTRPGHEFRSLRGMLRIIFRLSQQSFGVSDMVVDSRRWGNATRGQGVASIDQDVVHRTVLMDVREEDFDRLLLQWAASTFAMSFDIPRGFFPAGDGRDWDRL